MQKLKNNKRILLPVIIILTIIFIGVGIYSQSLPRKLYPGEILEYEGQNLSSINDFRENSIRGPQQINLTTYSLTITGLVNNTIEYSYEEILNNFQKYQKVTTLHCVEGWSVTILWEGFLLENIIEKAEIFPESEVVIFRAYDGYSTSLPLEYIKNQEILLAYKMNDIVLPHERGFPFQLVSESKYGYKWIKWITEIELSTDTDFRGYWETRGFSNDANID
jgi:DMSO/TMAO reductase YedYZ molybdopterin-dependent catalytic subunit